MNFIGLIKEYFKKIFFTETKEGEKRKLIKKEAKQVSRVKKEQTITQQPDRMSRGEVLKVMGISFEEAEQIKREIKERRKKELKEKKDIKTSSTLKKKKKKIYLPVEIHQSLIHNGKFCFNKNRYAGNLRGASILREMVIPYLRKNGISEFRVKTGQSPEIILSKKAIRRLKKISLNKASLI